MNDEENKNRSKNISNSNENSTNDKNNSSITTDYEKINKKKVTRMKMETRTTICCVDGILWMSQSEEKSIQVNLSIVEEVT